MRFRIPGGVLAVVALVLGAQVTATASAPPAGPAVAVVPPMTHVTLNATQPWSTCTARAWASRPGGYRLYNDQLAGTPGKDCISTTGYNLTITTSAKPQDARVVFAPAEQYGEYYNIRDAASGLPLPVSWIRSHYLTNRYSCTGHAAGVWTCDATDAWFSTTQAAADLHGTYELVIVTRSSPARCRQVGRVVRLGRRRWRAAMWRTDGGAVGSWPLMWFCEVRQASGEQAIRIPAFLDYAVGRHWLPASAWLDSDNPMVECWHGCHGLTVANQVTLRRGPA